MNTNRYFKWVCAIVNPSNGPYHKLLKYLFNTEFTWDQNIETDRNRSADGINLRWIYANDTGDAYDQPEKPASVLEAMTALSIRVEDMLGDARDAHPEHWFWMMIDNLDLENITDDNYIEKHVDDVIQNWMHRNYSTSGRGGAFPLYYSHTDQRFVPIWDQIFEYISENNL